MKNFFFYSSIVFVFIFLSCVQETPNTSVTPNTEIIPKKNSLVLDVTQLMYNSDGNVSVLIEPKYDTVVLNSAIGKTLKLIRMNSTAKTISKYNVPYVSKVSGLSVVNSDRTTTDIVNPETQNKEQNKLDIESTQSIKPYTRIEPKLPDLGIDYLTGKSTYSSNARSVNTVTTQTQDKSPIECDLGDEYTFTLCTDLTKNTWGNKTARLVVTTDTCNIWVVKDNLEDSSIDNTDNKLTTTQIERLSTIFDKLYTIIPPVFGDVYSENTFINSNYQNSEESPYITPQGKISIIIYDIDSDYANDQTNGVTGFFWAKDMLKQASNSYPTGLETIYIDSFFADSRMGYISSTLAHEFQHYLNFVNKTIAYNIVTETWFSEMLSMVCEDMVSVYLKSLLNDEFDIYSNPPLSRISFLNAYYIYSGVAEWLDGSKITSYDDSIISYAVNYAFGAFLARNYGGTELFKCITSNGETNIAAIEAALQVLNYTETIQDILKKFAFSFAYNNATEYTLNKSIASSGVETTIGDSVYKYPLSAINLWRTDIDDFCVSYNKNLKYYGPFPYDEDKSYNLPPYGFIMSEITDNPIEENTAIVVLDSKSGEKAGDTYLVIQSNN